jgi:hypothetical protein
VLGLERAEQGLLGTQNLDGATGGLGQVHERAGVGDEPGANELTDKSGQVGCQCLHAVAQIVSKVLSVLREVHDLLGQGRSGLQVFVCDFGSLKLSILFTGNDLE